MIGILKMNMAEITDGITVLARHIPANVCWDKGLSFFSSDCEFQQVGTWGYDAGKTLQAHVHKNVPRTIDRTQEVLFVKQGKIEAEIFDTSDVKVAVIEVCAGDILILLEGGHGYRILEDDTQVLEIKNGPYVGANDDRRRI